MDFETFCEYASNIEETDKNTEKTDIVSKILKKSSEETLRYTPLYIQGKLFPGWDDSTTDVGPKTVYTALAESSTHTVEEIEDLVADHGGVGAACEHVDFNSPETGQQKLGSVGTPANLTVLDVANTIEELSDISGSGSKDRKIKVLSNVLLDCKTSLEAKYFTRLVLEKLRIGVGSGTVRDAIAEAFMVNKKSVEYGLMVTNDPGLVAQTAAKDGETGLEQLEIKVGRPVSAMLAKKTDAKNAIDKANHDGKVFVEQKYDGARLLIHKDENNIQLYTRELVDITNSLPDVVEIVRDAIEADTAIVDSEVVAYESEESDEPLPFKQVMRRLKRKHDIEETSEEVSMDIHCFDILYKNGNELITTPLSERREILEETCNGVVADQWAVESPEKVLELEQKSLANGNEGVMVKNPSSQYKPNNRGWNWIKLKPDAETIDCAVVGGEWGEGRRADWVGSFMLAVDSDDGLKEIGKVATGITDEKLEELTERFKPLIESENGKEISFKPEIVFEVGYEEIQESPKYESGYGLRFPKLITVREDKSINDIDTVSRINDLA